MAWPAWEPRCQASTRAGTSSATPLRASPAVHQHPDDVGVDRQDRPQEVLLHPLEPDVDLAPPLAGLESLLAEGEDHHVGAAGGVEGGGEARAVILVELELADDGSLADAERRALGIADGDLRRHRCLDPLDQRHR